MMNMPRIISVILAFRSARGWTTHDPAAPRRYFPLSHCFAGHPTSVPLVFALVPHASVALLLYVIVGNSFFGLIAGYLYSKYGLESSMIAHMLAHVVMLTAIFFGV